jgi:predicted flavoprotein YhiN
LRESAQPTGDLAAMPAGTLAARIKALPIRLTGTAPIARAISSAGGISFGEIDDHFMLRNMPGVFVAGEMLDWEAPTGGYLLQACFSTGAAAARGALAWLARA